MIHNKICPYCMKALNKIENDPLCKSVEHLIPNAALTIKRGKGEGDFLACKSCNERKSNMDYVVGVIAKFQSKSEPLAVSSLKKAMSDNKAKI